MTTKTKNANLVFSIYIALSFYVFGGSMVNALVGYQTWPYVGANEFVKFHQVDSALIKPVFVLFYFILFIPQVLLFWYRPKAVSKQLVAIALVCYLVNLVSTITIQIPIQTKLDNIYDLALIEKLISTDLIFRRTAISCLAILNFIMLFRVINDANSE